MAIHEYEVCGDSPAPGPRLVGVSLGFGLVA